MCKLVKETPQTLICRGTLQFLPYPSATLVFPHLVNVPSEEPLGVGEERPPLVMRRRGQCLRTLAGV